MWNFPIGRAININSTLSYLENFTKMNMNELWNIKKYIWNIKRTHFLHSHHMNLMNQSRCLSLILCQNIQWRTEFLSHSLPEITTNPLQMVLHTINRLCHWEIERTTVGEFFKWLQTGNGKPTISYRCSVTKMTNGLGDCSPSFATWIEANL